MYDAWGNCTTVVIDENATDIANLNPFRYRSYYLDTGFNLYYLKTRYYDPEICRFITIDDLDYLDADSINGLNLYAYCLNNPNMNFDPTGNNPTMDFGVSTYAEIGDIVLGIITPRNNKMPETIELYCIYVKEIARLEGINPAVELSAGVLDVTFKSKKSNDDPLNITAFLGIGALNINTSFINSISGTIEVISATVGASIGEIVTISIKGYVGAGFAFGLSDGLRIGGGFPLGVELNLKINWMAFFDVLI